MLQSQFDQFRSRIPSQWLTKWGARLVLILLMIVVCILLISFVRMTWTERQIDQALSQQRATNEALRAENQRLKAEAKFRESDAFVEQAAREQLGMARPNETVLLPTVVLPASPAAEPAAVAEAQSTDGAVAPNYQRWWQAFFPVDAGP